MGGRAGKGASGGMGSRSANASLSPERDRAVDILRANRDSVISQIKYEYRAELKSGELSLKDVMEHAVDVAVKQPYYTSEPNRMKTNLRKMIRDMHNSYNKKKMNDYNMKTYGTINPKMSDVIGRYEEQSGTNLQSEWFERKFGIKPR